MVTAEDWPDAYPVGSRNWFKAMKLRLAAAEAGDPPASRLVECVKTTAEADMLIELVRRSAEGQPSKSEAGEGEDEGG